MHWRNVKINDRPTVLKRSTTLKVMLMLSFGYVTQCSKIVLAVAVAVFHRRRSRRIRNSRHGIHTIWCVCA